MHARRNVHMIMMFCLLGLLALGASVSAGDWGKITDADRDAVAPPDEPEAGAIILFSRGKMEIDLNTIKIDYHIRMKVLTEAGVDEIGDQSIRYFADGDKLKDFSAHTITPDGKKHKVEKDDIHERTSGNSRYETFAFPAVTPGSILELKFSILTRHYYFLRPWYFQGRLYTLESQLQVSMADGFDYDVQFYNVPPEYRQAEITSRLDPNSGGKVAIFTWRMTNLPPIKDEPYMSCFDDYCSAIRFHIATYDDSYNHVNFLKSWQQTGKEFQKYLDDYCNRDGDIADMAKTIAGGLTDPRAQSRALYDWVIKEYPMSESDQGDFLTNDQMSGFIEKKSGSIEERNLLLAKLHRALGLKAWPVLISTRDNARFDPARPGLLQFNTMITFVQFDDGWEFLDTSSPYAPYGLLAPNLLTDGGFLIDGEQSDLVRMFIKDAGSSRDDTTYMYVDSSGAVACTTRCVMSGYTAADYGRRFSTQKPEDFFDDNFIDHLDGTCTVSTTNCVKDSLGHVCVTLDYDAPEMARELDGNVVVKPVCFTFRTNPFKSRRRSFPVDFVYPRSYHNVAVIVPPTGLNDITPPSDTTFAIDGAIFKRKSHRVDSTFVVETSLTVNRPTFPPGDYAKVREFFDQVALAETGHVVLSPSSEAGPTVGAADSE